MIKRYLPALFWTALLGSFVLALLPQPPTLPGRPSDKLQHILGFVTLTVLGRAAWPNASALKIFVGLSAYGALIEFAQMIPMLNRYGDVADWIADTGAVLLVLALSTLHRRFAPARQVPRQQ